MTIKMPKASSAKSDLFVAYARFEFALKEAGFLNGKDGERAVPNWTQFIAEEPIADLVRELSDDIDVATLIAEPPSQQIIRGGTLGWAKQLPTPISSSRDLLIAVKVIRDNLFHGGKSGESQRDDAVPGRDQDFDRLLGSTSRC